MIFRSRALFKICSYLLLTMVIGTSAWAQGHILLPSALGCEYQLFEGRAPSYSTEVEDFKKHFPNFFFDVLSALDLKHEFDASLEAVRNVFSFSSLSAQDELRLERLNQRYQSLYGTPLSRYEMTKAHLSDAQSAEAKVLRHRMRQLFVATVDDRITSLLISSWPNPPVAGLYSPMTGLYPYQDKMHQLGYSEEQSIWILRLVIDGVVD